MIHIQCVLECDQCGRLVSAILEHSRAGLGADRLCWPRGSKEARLKKAWAIEPYGEMFCGAKCQAKAKAKRAASAAKYRAMLKEPKP